MKRLYVLISLAIFLASICSDISAAEDKWWKGNTHAHSWWSDGDAPPELVADWYKQNAYHFLVISDHNVMKQGEKWYAIDQPIRRPEQVKKAFEHYIERFGKNWIEMRGESGNREVKLKTVDDYRSLFEESGRFIFIKGEEITSGYKRQPVHMNGINLVAPIDPIEGSSIADTIQRNLDQVKAQELKYQQPMLTHVNHPNFHYAIQPEHFFDLDHEPGEGFFEMYNGHSGVDNYGDEYHQSMERLWDIVLSKRLGERQRGLIYGVATDDSHEYTQWGMGHTNPGRGWIYVRSQYLSPNMIVKAIKRGDFYNSTGVELSQLEITDTNIAIEVKPKPDTNYIIEFIGTTKDGDLVGKGSVTPHSHKGKDEHSHQVVYRYSDDIGRVLKRIEGSQATYKFSGNELYVRARITSSKVQHNPYQDKDLEMAWTQPVTPSK